MPGEVAHEIFSIEVVGDSQLRVEVSYRGEGCSPWYGNYGTLSQRINAVMDAIRSLQGVSNVCEGLTTRRTLRLFVNVHCTDSSEFKRVLTRTVMSAVQG